MAWKLKQLFRKLLPFLVIGGVVYGGYHLYRSSFRHGRPSFVGLLQKVPYFGSRFRHYSGDSRASYSGRHGRHHSARRHHHRRHRRH